MTDNAENTPENTKPVPTPNNRITLPCEWPMRMFGNLLIFAFVFSISFITVTIRTNLVGRQIDYLTEQFYNLTTTLGFTLDDILVEGRKKTSQQALLEV